MDQEIKKRLPAGYLLLYLLMIGFTFISIRKTGDTYVLYARVVQMIELLFLIALFIQNIRQGFKFNGYSVLVNSWWLFYTSITYLFTLHTVGLTPIFHWMNIIIFLLFY